MSKWTRKCAYADVARAQGVSVPDDEGPSAWDNAKLTIIAVLGFVASVYVATAWEAELRKVNWSLVMLVYMAFVFIMLFYRWSKARNTFDPLDMFLDPITNKVSPWRTMTILWFGLGFWTIATWLLSKDVPVSADKIITLYGIVLTGLVGKTMSGEWADAKAGRQLSVAVEPPPAPPQGVAQ